ncbi:MAG: hypothetical protein FD166_2728 [Bacteroidetes bacterium]|nr:MAG: hypothetical protein FD166_2728 [Bacteroidota bacterium]
MMKNNVVKPACIHSRLRYAVIMLLVVSLGAGLSSCNNQKKLAKKKAAQELADKTAKAKTDLLAIINDDGKMTLEEKEFKLASVKRMNLDNQEIKDLIAQAEEKLTMERAALEQKKEEERLQREREKKEREQLEGGPYRTINMSFDAVAGAGDVSTANMKIREALSNFTNEDVTVLILISSDGEIKDYDRPTTIRKYLEFIKDQKKSPNKVLNAVFDKNGKIKELELIKK